MKDESDKQDIKLLVIGIVAMFGLLSFLLLVSVIDRLIS